MESLREAIFQAICAKTAQEKCSLTQQIWRNFASFALEDETEILSLGDPTFSYFCKIVPPKNVPQGKFLKTDLSLAHLLHTLAHIEFSAIDLALDCAYRFKNLPKNYYYDWIEVANEEVKHFLALNALLESLGFHYGDFGVHSLLFDAMRNCNVLLDRIALIPRGMEAVGLDVNPYLYAKVSNTKHSLKNDFLETLTMILNDEISHVSKGNIWFHYVCQQEKIPLQERTKIYFEILQKYHFSFPKANAHLNTTARLQAGFSQEELTMLQSKVFTSTNPK